MRSSRNRYLQRKSSSERMRGYRKDEREKEEEEEEERKKERKEIAEKKRKNLIASRLTDGAAFRHWSGTRASQRGGAGGSRVVRY